MSKIKYYKRIVSGEVKELHYHDDRGDYIKGKSYPECMDSFNEKELEELELNDWLDEGLKSGIFKSEDFAPGLSSS